MKQFAFLLFIASFLVFSGCKDSEEKVSFTLTFKALYNGAPFAKNKYYDYDTYKIQFSILLIPSGLPSCNSSGNAASGKLCHAMARQKRKIAMVPTEVLRPSEVDGKGPP